MERPSALEGTIVISLDVEDFPQRVNQSRCAAISEYNQIYISFRADIFQET